MIYLNWATVNGLPNAWYFLENAILESYRTYGVYIVWHGSNDTAIIVPRTVRIGQGNVQDRLRAHSLDPTITSYARFGSLMATWAAVSPAQVDGVENYLADRLNPLIGERFPNALPIVVNLPW